jgi:hypothetical protein
MASANYSEQVQDLALDLGWRLWAQLGVSGWARSDDWTAIDVEPLIISTAYLGRLDARLLGESLDWCVSNTRLVSVIRLRNHLKTAHAAAREAFGSFAATVRQHSRTKWPGEGEPHPFERTGRSSVPELKRPAVFQLRLRAIFGVSARAEILRRLQAEPNRHQSIAELASAAAYGKDNVADAIELLRMAGVVEDTGAVGQRVYRLTKQAELAGFVGELPTRFPDWAAIFRVTLTFVEFARSAPKEPIVRAAEIRGLLRKLGTDLARVGLVSTLRFATAEALNEDFEGWSLRALRLWAGVGENQETAASGETSYSVYRLDTGSWLGTIVEPGKPPRPIEMPEWAGLYQEQPRSDTIIADDSIGAPRLAFAMFADAFRRIGDDIGPYWADDAANQILCRAFAEERLWPIRQGGSATFSEQFLRAWYSEHKARLGSKLPPKTQ